jgi:multidrug resistance efflux pump
MVFSACQPGLGLFNRAAEQADEQRIVGSGTIEAETVILASEMGGQVAAIYVAEGDEVSQGDLLVQLDASLLESKHRQLEVALDTARAELVEASAEPREEAIAVARAELAEAEAIREGAMTVLQAAEALAETPLTLATKVEEARGQVAWLEKEVEAAQAQLHAAEIRRDEAARSQADDEAKTVAQVLAYQAEAAQANLAATKVELEGARRQLALLQDMAAKPVTFIAQANAARRSYDEADVAVAVAEARLALAQADPVPEEVTIARAAVRQAEAAMRRVEIELEQAALFAPRSGVICQCAVESGELAVPGVSLLQIADLDTVTLRVFIPEAQVGQVRVGQQALVLVDAYPGETFAGQVSFIGLEAEFTPKNVQTQEDRVDLVFAVRIDLDNPDHRLKPGMPADAEIVGADPGDGARTGAPDTSLEPGVGQMITETPERKTDSPAG